MSERKRLLIVGAGGFGREVLDYVREIPVAQREWEAVGFLDDSPGALDGFGCALPILGGPLSYPLQPGDVLACAIGDPAIRLCLCRRLLQRGAEFVTIVHPTARLGTNSRIGVGCIFGPYSGISANAWIGDFAIINSHSGVGHDARTGAGCTLSAYCDITGGARLGEGVFAGTHGSVLPGVSVGDYAKIGAGSIVMRNVPARSTVVGNPARVIYTAPVPVELAESVCAGRD